MEDELREAINQMLSRRLSKSEILAALEEAYFIFKGENLND